MADWKGLFIIVFIIIIIIIIWKYKSNYNDKCRICAKYHHTHYSHMDINKCENCIRFRKCHINCNS